MKKNINYVTISKQLYVGIKAHNKHSDTDKNYPLGFATPFDKEDAAFKKRKETVDTWCDDKQGTRKFFDNVPLPGFKLADYSSRYSTDNKYVQVQDPRGFTVEISIRNLVDLVSETSIIKGVVQEPLIYARDGGMNVLLPESHEAVKQTKLETKTVTKLVPGDKVVLSKAEFIFLGEKYIVQIKDNYDSKYIRDNNFRYGGKYKYTFNWQVCQPEKAYLFSSPERDDMNYGPFKDSPIPYIYVYKSKPKIQRFIENTKIKSLKGKQVHLRGNQYGAYTSYNASYVFDTQQEAEDFMVNESMKEVSKLPKEYMSQY